MSADLFAEFEASPPTSQPKPHTATQTSSSFTSELFSLPTTAPAQNQPTAKWSSLKQPPANSTFGVFTEASLTSTAPHSTNKEEDDDDGWGDFAVAENPPRPTPLPNPSPFAASNSVSAQKPLEHPALQRTRLVRAPTIELVTNSLIDLPGARGLPEEARTPPWNRVAFDNRQHKEASRVPKEPKSDPNVLFDADDFDQEAGEEDDEDFGDFETVTTSTPAPAPASIDLLSDNLMTTPAAANIAPSDTLSSLSVNAPVSPYPAAPKSPSFQQRNPFPGLAVNASTESKQPQNFKVKETPVTAWPSFDQKDFAPSDDWADFEGLPDEPKSSKGDGAKHDDWDRDSVETTKKSSPDVTAKDSDSSWNWDPVDSAKVTPTQSKQDEAPPINVPPPSILLSIFPPLLSQAGPSLLKPISGQLPSVKNRILADPKTVEFLRGYLLLATVAARIIAGRKLRWQRDKFLSQGMSISAAGSKGMKLASVDKTQSTREDREAGDVVDAWKENVGRLRSSVAAANGAIKNSSEQLKIPDLRVSIPVRTAKAVPTASKPCVVCGLKRDERVPQVDYEVEDSFGEWWVDHWGHTACKRFWLQHENALRQR